MRCQNGIGAASFRLRIINHRLSFGKVNFCRRGVKLSIRIRNTATQIIILLLRGMDFARLITKKKVNNFSICEAAKQSRQAVNFFTACLIVHLRVFFFRLYSNTDYQKTATCGGWRGRAGIALGSGNLLPGSLLAHQEDYHLRRRLYGWKGSSAAVQREDSQFSPCWSW